MLQLPGAACGKVVYKTRRIEMFLQAGRSARAAFQAITFRKAALNFAISSAVPTVTRTCMGQLGQTRPM
jgi:hypothetical protein